MSRVAQDPQRYCKSASVQGVSRKFEYQSTYCFQGVSRKQIRMTKIQMTETLQKLFRTLENSDFGFVSDFGFRASNFTR
jgi:hypothetical protein